MDKSTTMRKILIITSALFFVLNLTAKKNFSSDVLKGIVTGEYNAKAPSKVISTNDGENYTQLSDDGKIITLYSYKKGAEEKVLFDASKTKNMKVESIEGYFFSPDEKKIMVYTNSEQLYRRSFVADYYVFDVKRNRLEALSDSVGKQRDPLFSPNGRMVVFAKNNDLRLRKLDYGTVTLITQNAADGNVFNGVSDWVYEEEFAITKQIIWSPDSKYFAYVSLDNTKVGEYSFELYGNYPFKNDADLYPNIRTFKYPKAGTTNPIASLNIFNVYYKKNNTVDLKQLGDFYIPRIKWINKTEDFAVFVLNRNQNRLKMYSVNSKSLIPSLLLEEKSDTYVDYRNIDYVTFLPDNKFSIASERDGFRHMYLYGATGILDQQLTFGSYDITDFYGYDTIKELFYYQAATTSPLDRNVYCVDLKAKSKALTEGKGVKSAQFNKLYTYFIKNSSTASVPNTYSVCAASGKEVRVMEDNTALTQQIATMPQKEFLTIKNAQDIKLNAWMMKPANFDESKVYPLVIYQYSGPDFQEVLDAYSVGLEQELVNKGFIAVCVDVRGSGARGEKFRKGSYQYLGENEAADLITVAKNLGSISYIDKNRIGIWGWSYGGFTTLMAMSTGQKVFAAGVAVAPHTDWKFYDTAYTERYMRRPQENLTGYDSSSPMSLASKLQGELLLIGGTADDNAHIQNIYAYAEQLVQANKQFDMQIYMNRNHGLKGGNTRYHMFTRITEFFIDNLK